MYRQSQWWFLLSVAVKKMLILVTFAMIKRQTIKEKIGKRIAELRKDKGLTQEQLAEKVGLDRTYIGYLEKGNRSPSVETANKIARALGVKINEVFKFE